MANASLGNIHLFLHFLCHPYILTDFVEIFYSSLVSALFMEHYIIIHIRYIAYIQFCCIIAKCGALDDIRRRH